MLELLFKIFLLKKLNVIVENHERLLNDGRLIRRLTTWDQDWDVFHARDSGMPVIGGTTPHQPLSNTFSVGRRYNDEHVSKRTKGIS